MRKSVMISLVLLAVLFFFPWLWAGEPQGGGQAAEEPGVGADQETDESSPDAGRTLRVKLGTRVEEMDMDAYLIGVLRGEMPASFEMEALKAQAVAARTYTLHKMSGGSANHPEADACDDVNCCKAWVSGETAAKNWGMAAPHYEEKLRAAVSETDGEVILYDNEPVLAVFHSSSAGSTRPAGEVWQQDLPYLRSVVSPEDESTVPNYRSEAVFSLTDFKERFIARYPAADFSAAPSNWFTNIRQTENGSVLSLQVGGEEVSGTQLRSLLDLRSAAFTIDFSETEVIFSVTGYGHGVGMSQYGANVLAGEGKTYREILAHYYVGTTIGVCE